MSEEYFDNFDDRPAGDSRRRKMNIFYLIDISGSMSGSRIESVNQVMPEVVELVRRISDDNKDNAEIFVSALLFSNGAKWLYSDSLSSEEFTWIPQSASGGTDLGSAYKLLEKALHRDTMLNSETGHKNPAIILLSDGEPDYGYEPAFEELKKNRWFQAASKVAFAIGDDANLDVLNEFTMGNKNERVIKVTDVESLKEMIKVATAAVSKHGTQTQGISDNGKEDDPIELTMEDIRKATEELSGAATGEDIASLPLQDEWD